MNVPTESAFADALRAVIREHRPARILETGTYLGLGSTAVLAEATADIGSRIVTVESNPHYVAAARSNLAKHGDRVKVIHALSITRDSLPTLDAAEQMIANAPPGVFIDYGGTARDAAQAYLAECQCDHDHGIVSAIHSLGGTPDLILLDSAGLLGWAEYVAVLPYLGPGTILALDDTRHLKHYLTIQALNADPRATLLASGTERHGWAVYRM